MPETPELALENLTWHTGLCRDTSLGSAPHTALLKALTFTEQQITDCSSPAQYGHQGTPRNKGFEKMTKNFLSPVQLSYIIPTFKTTWQQRPKKPACFTLLRVLVSQFLISCYLCMVHNWKNYLSQLLEFKNPLLSLMYIHSLRVI